MGTSSGATCSSPGCDQPPAWGAGGRWRCGVHEEIYLDNVRLRRSTASDEPASEASSAPTPDEGETGSDSDRLTGRERTSAGESQKRGVIYHTRRVIDLPPAIWCFAVGSIGALAASMRSLTFPGAGSSRPAPDSGGKVPSNMERRLFDASAYSNPFWSDTIDNENLNDLRHEVQRRWQVQGHASGRLRVMNVMCGLSALACVSLIFVAFSVVFPNPDFDDDTALLLFLVFVVAAVFAVGSWANMDDYRPIVNRGVTYRWPWIYERSVARFDQWLGSMGSTDPRLYAEVVNWLQRERQHSEEMARLAAIQRAQEAAEAEQQYQEQRYQEQERKAEHAAWTARLAAEDAERHARFDESDRLRAEQAQRYENEQSRQAAYQASQDARRSDQASQDARRSEPTCVFCDRPGMHDTASGWMCGIHLHHLM